MKKIDVKLLLLILFTITIIVSVIILWNNDNSKVDLIFNTILISLSINIISSVILIYFIDERDKKREINEKQRKENVIYKKLISIINEFNSLIINLYKATMTKKINEDDKILTDLYYDIDKLYIQLNKVNINKEGYKCTSKGNSLIRLNWKQCIIDDLKKLFKELKNFIDVYSFFLPSDILEELEKTLKSERNMYIIENDMINNLNEYVKHMDHGIEKENGKAIFEIVGFKNILISISNVMNCINELNKKNNFQININSFNFDNISPKIGSGL